MPKLVDHKERRERIAKAAAEAIADACIDAVTLTDIAAAAGFTTGAVTHYFQSKDEVMIAAMRYVARQLAERFLRQLRSGEDLASALGQSLPLDEKLRREWRVWLSFWGRAAFREQLARAHRVYQEGTTAEVKRRLEEARDRGEIRADLDLQLEAEALIALVNGIGMSATLEPEVWTAERQIRQLERQLAGMRPAAARGLPGPADRAAAVGGS